MHRSTRRVSLVATSALLASSVLVSNATAQDAKQADVKVPLKKLGAPEAKTTETISQISSMRALPDGNVFVNDGQQKRLVMLDASLKQTKIVADTLGAAIPYGQRQTSVISYSADSTIIVDPATLSLVILNKRGEISRVMSMPRPQDFNTLVNANLGANAFDSKGRLIYRAQGGPAAGGAGFGAGGARGGGGGNNNNRGGGTTGGTSGRGGTTGRGGGFGDDGGFGNGPGGGRPAGVQGVNGFGGPGGRGNQNANPDSVPILRANFDTRKTDTVTFVKVPKNEFATTPTPEGGTRVVSKINPLPQADDWALLSDGTVAVVRVLDYHVDWYLPDGTHASSEKLPFDWKRISDDDKVKMIDSLKTAAKDATERAQALVQGNNNFRVAFEPVAPERLPDYFPPIRQGTTHADLDGNLWILPATSAISAADVDMTGRGGRGGRGGGGGGGGAGGFGGGAGGAGGFGGGVAGAGGAAGGRGTAAGDSTGRGRGGRGAPGDTTAGPQAPLVTLNYDVVNRKGELVQRVQLPAGRTIAGFGPNGTIYLSARDGRNMVLERYKM